MNLLNSIIHYIFKNKRSIVTFLIVGLLSAFVYFASFTLLWKILAIHYNLAVSISYIFSIIFHFNANRYFTFRNREKKVLHHLIKYLIMVSFNYLVTLIIVNIVVEQFALSPYLGIVLSIGATMNTGYLLSRYWVFQTTTKI
jgi:putative flippase GtrA